jgi:hypothetical protein
MAVPLVCVVCCVRLGSYVQLITRLEESYRVCVCLCVCVCDLDTSKRGCLVLSCAVAPQKIKYTVNWDNWVNELTGYILHSQGLIFYKSRGLVRCREFSSTSFSDPLSMLCSDRSEEVNLQERKAHIFSPYSTEVKSS